MYPPRKLRSRVVEADVVDAVVVVVAEMATLEC